MRKLKSVANFYCRVSVTNTHPKCFIVFLRFSSSRNLRGRKKFQCQNLYCMRLFRDIRIYVNHVSFISLGSFLNVLEHLVDFHFLGWGSAKQTTVGPTEDSVGSIPLTKGWGLDTHPLSWNNLRAIKHAGFITRHLVCRIIPLCLLTFINCPYFYRKNQLYSIQVLCDTFWQVFDQSNHHWSTFHKVSDYLNFNIIN